MAPAAQGDAEVPVPAPNFSVTGPAAKTAIDQPEEVPIAAPIISVTGGAPPPSKDKIELPDAHDPVTGSGRWLYETKLGEGGLAVVFQAWDTKGGLGQVAVKVLKKHSKAHARHAFAMHRESQWSLQRLHNHSDPRYSESHASLFARYLEDHTGFTDLGPSDFEERRKEYESPKFDWLKHRIILPGKPYVVMELARGETLQTAMDREYRPAKVHDPPCLSQMEKHDVILQCIMALEYLERFCLIHRDFRGCNMQLIARRKDPAPCKLKILDLGVMISAEVGMEKNCNMAVQAFRRRGETEEQRKRYDWLPWEVRGACDDLKGPVYNFDQPGHAFDTFSLGVLILHLLVGKSEARQILESLKDHPERMLDASCIGIPRELLTGLLSEAVNRPRPQEVAKEMIPVTPRADTGSETKAQTPSKTAEVVPSRRRSRSIARAHVVSHTTTKVTTKAEESISDSEEDEVVVVAVVPPTAAPVRAASPVAVPVQVQTEEKGRIEHPPEGVTAAIDPQPPREISPGSTAKEPPPPNKSRSREKPPEVEPPPKRPKRAKAKAAKDASRSRSRSKSESPAPRRKRAKAKVAKKAARTGSPAKSVDARSSPRSQSRGRRTSDSSPRRKKAKAKAAKKAVRNGSRAKSSANSSPPRRRKRAKSAKAASGARSASRAMSAKAASPVRSASRAQSAKPEAAAASASPARAPKEELAVPAPARSTSRAKSVPAEAAQTARPPKADREPVASARSREDSTARKKRQRRERARALLVETGEMSTTAAPASEAGGKVPDEAVAAVPQEAGPQPTHPQEASVARPPAEGEPGQADAPSSVLEHLRRQKEQELERERQREDERKERAAKEAAEKERRTQQQAQQADLQHQQALRLQQQQQQQMLAMQAERMFQGPAAFGGPPLAQFAPCVPMMFGMQGMMQPGMMVQQPAALPGRGMQGPPPGSASLPPAPPGIIPGGVQKAAPPKPLPPSGLPPQQVRQAAPAGPLRGEVNGLSMSDPRALMAAAAAQLLKQQAGGS
eukprot:s315_g4.t1